MENRYDATLANDPTQSSCIWNLAPGGALYLTLWRRTPAEFVLRATGTTLVSGIGDREGYFDGIHLFVLTGTIELDVIVRSAEPDANRRERSVQVARTVAARL